MGNKLTDKNKILIGRLAIGIPGVLALLCALLGLVITVIGFVSRLISSLDYFHIYNITSMIATLKNLLCDGLGILPYVALGGLVLSYGSRKENTWKAVYLAAVAGVLLIELLLSPASYLYSILYAFKGGGFAQFLAGAVLPLVVHGIGSVLKAAALILAAILAFKDKRAKGVPLFILPIGVFIVLELLSLGTTIISYIVTPYGIGLSPLITLLLGFVGTLVGLLVYLAIGVTSWVLPVEQEKPVEISPEDREAMELLDIKLETGVISEEEHHAAQDEIMAKYQQETT